MTTHMTLTHDLQTLSWHQVIDTDIYVIIFLHHDYIPVSHLSYLYYFYILVSSSLQYVFLTSLKTYRESRVGCLEVYKKNYFQINAYPDSKGGSVKGVPLIAINESHG